VTGTPTADEPALAVTVALALAVVTLSVVVTEAPFPALA
jgi:hypothetical protein